MAIRYLTNIDLGTNEIQYPVLHPLTSAPTAYTAREGQMYYNSVDKKVKVYNGTTWISVGAVNSVTAGDGITLTGTAADPIVNHADTSSVSNLTASARTYVTGLTFDDFGHVTGFSTGTETVVDTNTTYGLSVNVSGSYGAIILTGSDSTTSEALLTGTLNEIELSQYNTSIKIGLPDDVNITNNLVVGGNLTVNGTTTTVNTETINLADNIILLNSNATGAPTENAGVEIERGSSDNRSLIWNETNDRWELQANDGSYYPIGYTTGADSYATSIGGSTSIVVTHNLGTRDVDVQLYDNSTYETVITDVVRTTTNTITVSFNTAPSAGSIRVLVKKIG